jgi:hypothetical protein
MVQSLPGGSNRVWKLKSLSPVVKIASPCKILPWNPAKETPEDDDGMMVSNGLSGDAEESVDAEFDRACASRATYFSFFLCPKQNMQLV